jgi:hypothetical protein
MKYLLTPWKEKSRHHDLILENKNPTQTTHIYGFGSGVTFSSRAVAWNHIFTSAASFLKYSEPDLSE